MKNKLLIVEDEPSIVTLLQYNLKKSGYETVVAPDGESAVHIIQERPFDLILLDVMLPGLSGYDVARNIRQHKIMIPIVMLTAKDSEEARIRGLQSGADDYLTKPFSTKELLARINAILRRTRVSRPDRISSTKQMEECK